MSDDEIRVAIAEKCGWTDINLYEDSSGPSFWNGYPPITVGANKDNEWEAVKAQNHKPLPDFPHDLNACHEFWQSMSDEDQERFCKELHSVSCPENCRGLPWHCSYVINATARQRCEAFLRVHGLWKDNPTPERSENRE